jgi:rod shape-determining protein MreB and related proteins
MGFSAAHLCYEGAGSSKMPAVDDFGIDLGTSNIVIYAKGKGIRLNEPAVVSVDRESLMILAIGADAQRMVGRTPGNIQAMRPLRDGGMFNMDITSSMLVYFVMLVSGKHLFSRPRIVISPPSGINDSEQHKIISSLFEAGARRTQILERPIAAAVGAGMKISEAYGSMIVDIGAGMTDIAVLSLGRAEVRDAVKVGGDAFDEAIIRYLRRKHNLLIGERTAEELKINIGSARPREDQLYMEVTGRNLISGLPKVMRINSDEIYEAFDAPLTAFIEAIHTVLERTPAELASDVFDNGIVLSGGGAQLAGLAEAVHEELKVECRVADHPQECVAVGCGRVLEQPGEYSRLLNDGRKRV